MRLPTDIIQKIESDYNDSEQKEVLNILESLYKDNAKVGSMEQAIRGLIYIANSNIKLIKEYCIPYLQYDPRDIIMEAEEKAGNPGHWFGIPFSEMTNSSNKTPNTSKEHRGDELSF